jgi:hypothetical protein
MEQAKQSTKPSEITRSLELTCRPKEYIIETRTKLIVEIPSRGHATYLFAAPGRFSEFMAHYAGTTKDDIRTNKNGIAERLGWRRAANAIRKE